MGRRRAEGGERGRDADGVQKVAFHVVSGLACLGDDCGNAAAAPE
jgi:hypothetical protein